MCAPCGDVTKLKFVNISRNFMKKCLKQEIFPRSWNSFVAGINEPVSTSIMWRDIERLTGNNSHHHITQLLSTDPLLISETPAKHYSTVSPNSNYDPSFLAHKIHTESTQQFPFDAPEAQTLVYNLPITLQELTSTINNHLRNAVSYTHLTLPTIYSV